MACLYEILLPAAAPPARHRAWEKHVASLAGGVSLPPGQIRGRWKGKGDSLTRERQIPVRVACLRSELSRILRFTARHYRQEEVMAYRISDQVVVYREGR